MPFVEVPNTVMIEMRMLQAGEKVENTLYFTRADAWDIDTMTTLATDIKNWWAGNYAHLVTEDTSLREVVASDLTTATGLQVSVSGGGSLGSVSSTACPNNVTLAVSFRTGMRGRSFRGRNYIAGIPLSVTNDTNEVLPSYVTSVIDEYDNLLGAPTIPVGVSWVVVSRFSGVDADGRPIPRATGIATDVASIVVTDLTLDSMRRRLPGRGQ